VDCGHDRYGFNAGSALAAGSLAGHGEWTGNKDEILGLMCSVVIRGL
jgi:hypothetical protein